MPKLWVRHPGTVGAGTSRRRTRPRVEWLEGRALLSGSPTDYVLSGFQWSDPGHITYSIAPDGVAWGQGTNVLNATFDAEFGAGVWEREIARALATWEASANINISQVSETGAWPIDASGQEQGDPRFGDIRVGGSPYPGNTQTLAETYYPSGGPDTIAGNLEINTGLPFHIGSDTDLYSLLLHETGHALGLAHAADPAEVMDPVYQGVRQGLSAGDVAGIQALYGARTPDAYQGQGQGLDLAGAIPVALNGAAAATVNNVSLATAGDTEYFSVVAPAGATALRVTAAAGGVSLLSPKVSLFDASGNTLDVEANPSAWGDDVSAAAQGVVPGQRYAIAVTGATTDVFAVGAYQLQVAFTVAPAPTITPAPAPTAPATPPAPAPVSPPAPAPAPPSATVPAIPTVTVPATPRVPVPVTPPVTVPVTPPAPVSPPTSGTSATSAKVTPPSGWVPARPTPASHAIPKRPAPRWAHPLPKPKPKPTPHVVAHRVVSPPRGHH